MSSRDPGSVCLLWLTPDYLLYLELWHLLSPLARSHPSALSICSKLHLSVLCVTISPPLRGSSSRKHWHIAPLQFQLASTSCYLSSDRHARVTRTLTTFENSRLTHAFLSSVCNRGRDIRVLKSARQPSDLLCGLGFGTVPLIWLMDDFFVWFPQPNDFYIWFPPVKWFLYLTAVLKGRTLLLLTCLVSTENLDGWLFFLWVLFWITEFQNGGCLRSHVGGPRSLCLINTWYRVAPDDTFHIWNLCLLIILCEHLRAA